ncbi:MAG: F0F1 ATP synthase subunit delta [Armatimonadota bacterium]
MQIDWITVIAQIVNFLILVWLLKRFLYGPIVQTMQDRQQRIAAEMEEAREREQEAKEEARDHREKRQELEEQREERMREAERAADQRREELISEAREEVEAIERRWHENLREERDAFIRQLRQRLGHELCSVARRALADLANRELQEQVVDVFIGRLDDLGEDRREELKDAFADADEAPVITSAFSLSESHQQSLVSVVHELLGEDAEVSFREDEELLCGIALNIGGVKVAWSLDTYLDSLEETMTEELERETGEELEKAAEEAMPPTEIKPPEDEDEDE